MFRIFAKTRVVFITSDMKFGFHTNFVTVSNLQLLLSQMLVSGVTSIAELLSLGKQNLGSLGEGSGQSSETGLAHHEVQQLAIGLLAGQDERVLTLGLQLGHIAPQRPIAALAGFLLLQLSLAHTLGDTVVDAGCVSDDMEGP